MVVPPLPSPVLFLFSFLCVCALCVTLCRVAASVSSVLSESSGHSARRRQPSSGGSRRGDEQKYRRMETHRNTQRHTRVTACTLTAAARSSARRSHAVNSAPQSNFCTTVDAYRHRGATTLPMILLALCHVFVLCRADGWAMEPAVARAAFCGSRGEQTPPQQRQQLSL